MGFWAPHWAASDPPGPRARTNIIPPRTPTSHRCGPALLGRLHPPDPTTAQAAPPPSQDQSSWSDPRPAALGVRALLGAGLGRHTPGIARPTPSRGGQYVLWNEPNIPAFILPQWDGPGTNAGPSPGRYRAMVQAAYPAIKAVRPDAKVLIGNTSSTGGRRGSGAVAPLEFVRELACVDADRFRWRPLPAPRSRRSRATGGRTTPTRRTSAPRGPARPRASPATYGSPTCRSCPPRWTASSRRAGWPGQPQHLPHRVRLRDPHPRAADHLRPPRPAG